MNKVISWVKKVRLHQIFTVFVLGVLVFFTQACSPSTAAQSTQSPKGNAEVYVPKGDNVINPYEGGMNNFSDRDPRAKSDAKARGEYLKENAAQNQAEKSTNNPLEAIRRVGSDAGSLGKNVQQKAEDVGNKVQNTAEDFARGTKQGVENIKGNTQDAGDYAKDITKHTVRDTLRD
ncbi:MAG: hypothetical protein NHB32_08230 [Fischerella sp. CENA71]|nr:hypothetical protein [Fischerella sp. CENA71]